MSKKIFWVDVPKYETLGPEGTWINVGTFNSRKEAIEWIKENIDSSSKNGSINLITEGVDEDHTTEN